MLHRNEVTSLIFNHAHYSHEPTAIMVSRLENNLHYLPGFTLFMLTITLPSNVIVTG